MTDKERLTVGLLSEQRPAVIEDLNNGQQTKHYNHNIKQVFVVKDEHGAIISINDTEVEGSIPMFQYDCLRVEFPVDPDNTFKTLLNAKYGKDEENRLQNEYQSAVLGLLPESYKEPYQNFLRDRIAIKSMIDQDFKA